MDFYSLGYLGLFLSGFLSATIVPLASEGVLLFMLESEYSPVWCLIIATVANVLGGLTNYILGYWGNKKWFKKLGVKESKLNKFESYVQRYGFWLAFFSWVPIVGDPMTIALGFFKANFWKVTLLMIIGKFLRYLVFVIPYLY